MILNVHSDASYLSASKARSRAGGYFFLGSIPRDSKPIIINDAIHITCIILKLVAVSAAEAELSAYFSMHRKLKYYSLSLKNLGTHNHLHLFTSTIQLPLALSTTQSKDNGPEPWRYKPFGYLMAKSKNCFIFITNLVKRT